MGPRARIAAVAAPLTAWMAATWTPSLTPEGAEFARAAAGARTSLSALSDLGTAHVAALGALAPSVNGLAALSWLGAVALLGCTAWHAHRIAGGVAAAGAATALAVSAPFVVASGAVGPTTWVASFVWVTIALGTSGRGGWWRAPVLFVAAALALANWPPTLFVGATLLLCALLVRDGAGGVTMPLRLAMTPAVAVVLGVASSPWWWGAPLEGARDLLLGALDTNPPSIFRGDAVSGRLPWYAGLYAMLTSLPTVALVLSVFGAWSVRGEWSSRTWALVLTPLTCALTVAITGAVTLHGVDAVVVASPAFAILAGVGFARALSETDARSVGMHVALAAALVVPAGWRVARAHPHADSVTNTMSGGRLASGLQPGRTGALPVATIEDVAARVGDAPIYLGALEPLVALARPALSRDFVVSKDPTTAAFVFERVVLGAPPQERDDGMTRVQAYGVGEAPTFVLWGR